MSKAQLCFSFLFLIVYFPTVHCTITSMFMRKSTDNTNVYSSLNNIGDFDNLSLIRCTNRCLLKTNCSFLFYHSPTQRCVLQKYSFDELQQFDSSSFVASTGWAYYEKYTDEKLSCESNAGFVFSTLYRICYHVGNERTMDFDEISNTCAAKQSKLVRIDSALKQIAVATLLETGENQYDRVCVQGNNNNPSRVYQFDDGTEMTYFNWNIGQPNGATENSIYIRRDALYKWHDVDHVRLDMTCAYMCEKL